jgi:hypothetical protein
MVQAGQELAFILSVIGKAYPYGPRSSKYGEEENVVACEVRTITTPED